MKRSARSFGWVLITLMAFGILCGFSNGYGFILCPGGGYSLDMQKEDPRPDIIGLLYSIKAGYMVRDVTVETDLLFRIDQGYYVYDGLHLDQQYKGILAKLHVSDSILQEWHDYYLIHRIENLYKMSHDSCRVRSVASEIDGIRLFSKKLLTADLPRIGGLEIDEAELTYCYNEGELFTARAILNNIGTSRFVSDDVKRVIELESKGLWTFADLSISLDSLNAIEANDLLSDATQLKLTAIRKADNGLTDEVSVALHDLWFDITSLEKNPGRSNRVLRAKLQVFRSFASSNRLVERSWEVVAGRRLRVLRTATPGSPEICGAIAVMERAIVNDDDRFNPIKRFEEAQQKSGRPIEYYLPRAEYEMWKRKWSSA